MEIAKKKTGRVALRVDWKWRSEVDTDMHGMEVEVVEGSYYTRVR